MKENHLSLCFASTSVSGEEPREGAQIRPEECRGTDFRARGEDRDGAQRVSQRARLDDVQRLSVITQRNPASEPIPVMCAGACDIFSASRQRGVLKRVSWRQMYRLGRCRDSGSCPPSCPSLGPFIRRPLTSV
ncbi:hypothetical protein SKAU_G00258150 [Synaphobranchus kaupii]|uniref:Uncharacterized protein n=1 Tax=Synaphobranchus kaupii TaxID=118154 RepID=A0A9Q1F475_SYNKA|nr:hypothetical protein SKAU_G00258150 [Synaphobranchus kaupii]